LPLSDSQRFLAPLFIFLGSKWELLGSSLNQSDISPVRADGINLVSPHEDVSGSRYSRWSRNTDSEIQHRGIILRKGTELRIRLSLEPGSHNRHLPTTSNQRPSVARSRQNVSVESDPWY